MVATGDWSARWCADKLKHEKVSMIRVLDDNLIEIEIEETGRVLIATMALKSISLANLPSSALRQDVEFILNIPKDPFFQGDLINFADRVPVGLGGVSDLMRAINKKDLRNYKAQEREFLLRILSMHDSVASVEMLNNATYVIHRNSMAPYKILALNEYDVTADVVRTGLQRFGHSRTIFASNPNGRVTPEGRQAAKDAGSRIVDLRQLLGALNS